MEQWLGRIADCVYASTGLNVPLLESSAGCANPRSHVCPGACTRASSVLHKSLIGQTEPVNAIVDSVCDHWSQTSSPERPLALALHGPPGVGKSFAHKLLARSAFNASGSTCPGSGCRGYTSLFATDYAQANESEHTRRIQHSLEQHLRKFPAGVVAIEEYDRAGCSVRGLLRHLLDRGVAGSAAAPRSTIVLEANTGWLAIARLANGTSPSRSTTISGAHGSIKSLMHKKWADDGCGESAVDTQRLLSLISNFVPFYPLREHSMREMATQLLKNRQSKLSLEHGISLSWDMSVPRLLAQSVDYEDGFAVEGAMGAQQVDKYVSRVVRSALEDSDAAPDSLHLRIDDGRIVAKSQPR